MVSIIDLLLIQQLSQVDSLILGLAIAVVLFLLSNSKGKKAVGSIRKNLFKYYGDQAGRYSAQGDRSQRRGIGAGR